VVKTEFHLAQFNIARARAPLTDPMLADFVDLLDEINALADRSPGFVWRLQSEAGNATDFEIGGDPQVIANMSVWESPDALFDYVYRSGHIRVLSRKKEWFERSDAPSMVLWWIPVGTVPTLEDGLARLAHLYQRSLLLTHRAGFRRFSVRSAWRGGAGHREPRATLPESLGKPPFRSPGRTAGVRRETLTMHRIACGPPPARRIAQAISMGQ